MDIFGEAGTPKYASAQDIYDALQEMCNNEESGILADLGADVSWEGQTYYYTDKGDKLLAYAEGMAFMVDQQQIERIQEQQRQGMKAAARE